MSNIIYDIMDVGLNDSYSTEFILMKMKAEKIENNIIFSAERLLKAWQLYNKENIYLFDFELCLRDFLLLVNIPLKINNYEVSNYGCEIGLHKNNGNVECFKSYPSYINKKFATRVAEEASCKYSSDKNYFLKTSYKIMQLSNNQFDKFKSEEQKLCVLGALKAPKGYSILISMPTGGGKSLITQSLTLQNKNGLTIVIVPTISLMIDQYNNAKDILNLKDDEILLYYSSSNVDNLINFINSRKLRMLFISPESLIKNRKIQNAIFDAALSKYINNIIIDEAHIVLEWGDSFRLDYQCLDVFCNKVRFFDIDIRIFLLSATFTQNDVKNLEHFYSLNDKWIELRCDSLRKEIHYNFVETQSYIDKLNKTIELVKFLPHPMIVYVNRPEEANNLLTALKKSGINNARIFTGETTTKKRNEIINEWKSNEFQIMVATCAFGVGVDKKDVRTVLHTYVPDNSSKYYQEAGRGGRDGNACLSVIIYNEKDFDSSFSFINKKVLTTEKIVERWFSMLNNQSTISYNDGKYMLDMSVVPSYGIDDYFITISNSKHIAWNVYVILFLKRHLLLDVIDVIYENDNYYLIVKINNVELRCKSDIIFNVISNCRDDEWNKMEKGFQSLKKAIVNSSKECISELFLKTYPLIKYDYCAGCDSHKTLIYQKNNFLPLCCANKFIDSRDINWKFEKKVLIVKGNDFAFMEKCFSNNFDFTIIQLQEKRIESNSSVAIFSYAEFYKLIKENLYFVSNNVIFECPDSENDILKMISAVDKLVKIGINCVILTMKNYYIVCKDKYLYDLIESSYKDFYI